MVLRYQHGRLVPHMILSFCYVCSSSTFVVSVLRANHHHHIPMPNATYSLRNYLWIIYLYNPYELNINISTFTPQVKKLRPGEVLWLIQAHTVSEWRSNWLLHDNPWHWPGTLLTFASSSSCSPTPLAPALQPHKPPLPSFQGHVPPHLVHSQLQGPFSSFPLL